MSNAEAPKTKTPNSVLEDSKDKFEAVMVCGVTKDGQIVVSSSMTNVLGMHWMLNRSLFEVCLFEKQSQDSQEEKAA
jgi:hypothetical protein